MSNNRWRPTACGFAVCGCGCGQVRLRVKPGDVASTNGRHRSGRTVFLYWPNIPHLRHRFAPAND